MVDGNNLQGRFGNYLNHRRENANTTTAEPSNDTGHATTGSSNNVQDQTSSEQPSFTQKAKIWCRNISVRAADIYMPRAENGERNIDGHSVAITALVVLSGTNLTISTIGGLKLVLDITQLPINATVSVITGNIDLLSTLSQLGQLSQRSLTIFISFFISKQVLSYACRLFRALENPNTRRQINHSHYAIQLALAVVNTPPQLSNLFASHQQTTYQCPPCPAEPSQLLLCPGATAPATASSESTYVNAPQNQLMIRQ